MGCENAKLHKLKTTKKIGLKKKLDLHIIKSLAGPKRKFASPFQLCGWTNSQI